MATPRRKWRCASGFADVGNDSDPTFSNCADTGAVRQSSATSAIIRQRMGTSRKTAAGIVAISRLPFHLRLGFETLPIARNGGHSQCAAGTLVGHRTVTFGAERAIDGDAVPVLGVTDIADGDVVVLAPEERHRREPPFSAQDVLRRHLALAFGHHKVLDANPIASERIGPAR